MSVKNTEFDEVCNYDTWDETEWGCKHEGDALIENRQDDNFEDSSEQESIRIRDGSDSDFIFTISTYENPDKESANHHDHKMHGMLNITINGEEQGIYSQWVADDMGDKDPSPAADTVITISCNVACNCVINQQETPSAAPSVTPYPTSSEKPTTSTPTESPTAPAIDTEPPAENPPTVQCPLDGILHFPEPYYYGYHNDL